MDHGSHENDLCKWQELTKNQQVDDHLGVEVGGKLSVWLMKMVCIISMVVGFTFSASAKKEKLE